MPPRKAKKSASGDVFDGLTFCVSGSFSMSQSEMKSLLTDNGGKVAGSVTNAVTHVVSDQISSAKTHTAVGKGLPIVSEQWVTDSVEAGALSTDSDLFVHQPDGSITSKKGKTASKKGKKKDDDEEEEEEEEEEEAPKKKAPAKKAASKKAASKRKKADDDEEEEDEEDDPPAKKPAPTRKSGRATKSTKKADDDDDEEEEEEEEDEPPAKKAKTEPEIKKVVVKAGSAPVDDICPVASSCVVYQEGSDVWDAMLNQTNIGNNNNKYYVIQLLQNTSTGEYYAWNKWGRVGKIAGQALVKCGKDLNRAKQDFMKKFKDKTKNDWANRANFTPYNGKYTLLERDYSADDEDTDMPAADDDDADGETKTNGNNKKGYPDSKLDPRVQDLIKLICDVRMMEAALIEVGYDAKKLPLGKLSKRHIQQGYEVLKKISDALDNGASHNRLTDLSSEFYTLIPHDFGMTRPPVISTKPALKLKLEMVEQLADIEIATKLLKGDSQNHKINPLDAHYDHLKCDMKPLDNDDETVTLIKKYVKNTHAATHSSYSLEVQQVFDLDREGEAKRYEAHADNENRMLLWHGSRLTNFVGILSQGLRIAPPEAPVTGYMFGKGVYFADMVSKSANYCNASSGNNIACMLLCEVALGGMNQKLAADYNANKLPAGKLSTLGAGKTAPDPNGAVTLEDGVVVPCGPGTDSGVTGTSLLYNEFIVYDTAQIKMRYLIKMKFNYKR